ncbi:MAG: hypothetical protein C4551_02995 [Bacillota bacterium]|nr:MAG: hypothetical protein C4551_02995 [Bacillota bacterium]
MRDHQRWVTGAIGVFRDITPLKEAEAERSRLVASLEAERGYLRSVLEQMLSGVIITEAPSGREILRNARAQQLLGGRSLSSPDDARSAGFSGRTGPLTSSANCP